MTTAASTSTSTTSGTELRLAELVAALSLGVDLGFDQPMEHVLRQTVITLRLADRLGLPAEQRSALYYSSLLVNVGCHVDAHEQAKWFGDDIALKATKYRHDPRSLRGAIGGLWLIGAGRSPLHRLRVGLDFALGVTARWSRWSRVMPRLRPASRHDSGWARRPRTPWARRTSGGTGAGGPAP